MLQKFVLLVSLLVFCGFAPQAEADDWKALLHFDGSRLKQVGVLLNQGHIARVETLLMERMEDTAALQERALYAYLIQAGVVLEDPARAIVIAQEVIERAEIGVDAAIAHLVLARAYAYGMEKGRDLLRAMEHLETARNMRIPEAFVQSAVIGLNNPELGVGMEEARLWLRRAVDFGNPGAYAVEAVLMMEGRLEGGAEEVERALRRGMAEGSRLAEFQFALLLIEGYFDETRKEEGLAILEELAGRGYPEANNLLAELYFFMGENEENEVLLPIAVRMLEIASEAGLMRARMNLGLIHAWGLGVEHDPAKAREYLEEAALSGFVPAMGAVGALLLSDVLGARDTDAGRRYLYHAAIRGDSLAQHDLAISLLADVREPDEAVLTGLAWLEIATFSEDVDMTETYWLVASQYNAIATERARDLARSCVESRLRGCLVPPLVERQAQSR